ncbi:MAG: RluA family pseudouridine synthase [Verrucomicrobia bacterium]|nr:RluA family pseudouridine synthase [Verrucomicrobiota bacterium]MBI3870247.1 RluA family pseudouridine synthase [Verrucomicrobiota bacterium]
MDARTQKLVVDCSLPGVRLDTFLRDSFPVVSRGTFKRLIDEGHVLVDGRVAKATHSPQAGEEIEVHFPPAKPTRLEPVDLPLDVLFEDEHLLVVNKPVGLVVHPASGEEPATLVHALLHHCRGQLSGIGGVERPGIVHRIDRDTSGCLVVAKHDQAHLGISSQFKERTVNKIYHAIACGEIAHLSGDIRARLGRHANHRMSVVVDESRGREAWTTFQVRERWGLATLAEVKIHTGRTHQIRVHFQHIGHPLAGDTLYGKRQNGRLRQATGVIIERQMLHAHLLEFHHPIHGQPLSFRAPWPDDFEAAARQLRDRANPVG